MKIKSNVIHIVIFLCFILAGSPKSGKFLRADGLPFKVKAGAYVVMDQKTGLVLAKSREHELYYPASITKILTALLALEKNAALDTSITLSRKAAYGIEPGSSSIGLKPDETVRLDSLIYALMLRSANEAGNALAEWVSGTNDRFSRLMNERIRQWGAKHSHFKNPHGLPDKEHKVTAYDMALITREAMKIPFFREVAASRSYPFPGTNKHAHRERGVLKNKNLMLNPKSRFYHKACIGVKGGFTKAALHTFVASFKRDDAEFIVVVLREPSKDQMYTEMVQIADWALTQYEVKKWQAPQVESVKLENAVFEIKNQVTGQWQAYLPLKFDISHISWRHDRVDVELPLQKGDVTGYLTPVYKDVIFETLPVVAANDVFKTFSREHVEFMLANYPTQIYGVVFALAAVMGYALFKMARF